MTLTTAIAMLTFSKAYVWMRFRSIFCHVLSLTHSNGCVQCNQLKINSKIFHSLSEIWWSFELNLEFYFDKDEIKSQTAINVGQWSNKKYHKFNVAKKHSNFHDRFFFIKLLCKLSWYDGGGNCKWLCQLSEQNRLLQRGMSNVYRILSWNSEQWQISCIGSNHSFRSGQFVQTLTIYWYEWMSLKHQFQL